MTSALLSLANFLIALAASTASPLTNAIAVGPTNKLVETLDARLRRGTLDQRVLGDRVGGGVTERPTQVFEVGHRQSAVLGDERRRASLNCSAMSATAVALSALAMHASS